MNLERTFFVTTVTWKRTPIFRQHASAQLMVDVLKHYAEQGKFVLHEFVIMPDHLHLLLTPAKDISLERALQVIKGGFSSVELYPYSSSARVTCSSTSVSKLA